MKNRIKKYLDDVFQPYENSESVRILKEELLNDMQEKYDDLMKDGLDEESSYQRIISDLGDISEIIKSISDKTDELHQRINWNFSRKYMKNSKLDVMVFTAQAINMLLPKHWNSVKEQKKCPGKTLFTIQFLLLMVWFHRYITY